jgi:hypothetical protein
MFMIDSALLSYWEAGERASREVSVQSSRRVRTRRGEKTCPMFESS